MIPLLIIIYNCCSPFPTFRMVSLDAILGTTFTQIFHPLIKFLSFLFLKTLPLPSFPSLDILPPSLPLFFVFLSHPSLPSFFHLFSLYSAGWGCAYSVRGCGWTDKTACIRQMPALSPSKNKSICRYIIQHRIIMLLRSSQLDSDGDSMIIMCHNRFIV